MLSSGFLLNGFLESCLLIFGKNKYINLRRYWTIFFHDQSLKISKIYSFVYNKVYLVKAASETFLPFTKNI